MYTDLTRVLFISAIAIGFVQGSLAFADETAAMTNDDVIGMFQAGLSSEVIITQIEQTNEIDFDLATSTLIELSKLGVPSEVVAAMQKASQNADSIGAAPEPQLEPPQPQSPQQSLQFANRPATLIADGEKHTMYAAKMAGMKLTAGAYVPFAGSKAKTKIAGSRARLRIKDSFPVFEVSIATGSHPEDSIALVKVKSKEDVRLMTTGRVRGAGYTGMIPEKDKIPIRIESAPGASAGHGYSKEFRVALDKALEPGEYVVVVSHQYFDFAIDR